MTPLDITRYNTSLVNGDIQHLGIYSWQLGGNRPIPGWGQYRTPIDKLYMTAGSTHPGGGVTGGPGRNAAQVIFEDLGLDFDERSEGHTSELQSLMRISYAVFCLKKKNKQHTRSSNTTRSTTNKQTIY